MPLEQPPLADVSVTIVPLDMLGRRDVFLLMQR
jgi:hypothetical protein